MKIHACQQCGEQFAVVADRPPLVCPFCRASLAAAAAPVELTVCAPIWCEQDVIEELVRRCAAAAAQCTPDYEIILVDDGSTDETWPRIKECARQNGRVRGIRHSRNFGLQSSVTTALEKARGKAIVIIDGDLEDPPELIPSLYRKWREGADVVYTIKEERRVGLLKKALFKLFYALYSRLASPPMAPQSGLFCLIDRRIADRINALPERVRYVPGLRSWVGFKQVALRYTRDKRYDVTPRQSLVKLFQMAVNALTSFSSAPLQFGLGLGFLSLALCFCAIVAIVCVRLFTNIAVPGWATYTTLLVGLAGFLSVYISIIGCYLGHVYIEVKRRPHSLIEEET